MMTILFWNEAVSSGGGIKILEEYATYNFRVWLGWSTVIRTQTPELIVMKMTPSLSPTTLTKKEKARKKGKEKRLWK
jgi:hypothetical protein